MTQLPTNPLSLLVGCVLAGLLGSLASLGVVLLPKFVSTLTPPVAIKAFMRGTVQWPDWIMSGRDASRFVFARLRDLGQAWPLWIISWGLGHLNGWVTRHIRLAEGARESHFRGERVPYYLNTLVMFGVFMTLAWPTESLKPWIPVVLSGFVMASAYFQTAYRAKYQ